MHRFLIALFTLPFAVAFGQEAPRAAGDLFNKAPQGVEEALRERVKQFYLRQIEGKFRQAEALVCEESKDLFYNSDKQSYKSFEIIKVSFEEDFKKAKVVATIGSEMVLGGMKAPASVPRATSWQLENGQWCNLILPPSTTGYVTPFGIMKPGPDSQGAMSPTTAPPVSAASIRGGVRVSTKYVTFNPDAPASATIEVENRLPGGVSLKLEAPDVKGLEWSLAKTELASGDKAEISIRYRPVEGAKVPTQVGAQIRVSPISSTIAITVVFPQTK